ncbi:hypothetical protein BD324DRAFT_583370 [Kockovaella imperatae]|uniref:allantoinase n=1 Tax=Kockovaella imperatae TaxID=4999 RepID=A0A1Y1U8W4_9TREE|nr:hypothetical protein BD324DRAFT_583370 [Kockovaella imperatae]ORX34452.1 hypothetical protein BD324DRAFT_583370 [Kockovaella imperatae]
MAQLVVVAENALLPGETHPRPAKLTVDLESGRIRNVQDGIVDIEDKDGVEILRVTDEDVLLPGLIDCHVHLNQPGRTDWEGFQTGTLAAISGGVTTLIDMPLNSIPPTTTVAHLNEKREEARRVGMSCDLGFWGGIIPGNSSELRGLLKEGVKGFKCFLIESGVEEFPCVGEEDLLEACNALEGTNALILFHAELDSSPSQSDTNSCEHPERYSTFLRSRPPALELDALSLILRFAKQFPSLRFHIVHLSASSALPVIQHAREEGMQNLTVETCFHYLTLSSEDIPENRTEYKCCPPIRDEVNRQALLQGVRDGIIDFVVSDHSPCTPELKKGDFLSAWGGVSSLGLGLQLLWTELGGQGQQDLPWGRIVDLLCARQAKQVGIDDRKGGLAIGKDADFVIFSPKQATHLEQSHLNFKNKMSPYVGKRLNGSVKATYIRGQQVWDGSQGKALDPKRGHFI